MDKMRSILAAFISKLVDKIDGGFITAIYWI